MTWKPNYSISNQILSTIRQIGEVLGEIRSFGLPASALAKLESEARELSTFASTSIEGNPLALTDVKRLLKRAPERLRDTEREILNYNDALEYVHTLVEEQGQDFRVDIKLLRVIQAVVTDGLMDTSRDCGHLRERPVVIRDPRRPGSVVFMPPNVEDVPQLTEELCGFINAARGEIDPILLAGLFHRQHVIIHPFMDGNGRTTRIITTALLGASGLNLFDIFSFENYYNQNTTRYFQKVGLVGDYYDQPNPDFTEWLEYFAEGILDELKRVEKSLPRTQPRMPGHYKLVLDYIAEHGSITQREYGEISSRSLASRKLDLTNMVKLELIEPRGGGRSRHYRLVNG